MSKSENRFSYPVHSRAFLERAIVSLRAFDDHEDAGDLCRAALELRYGIEARLFEYIRASLKEARQRPKRITEYSATALLRKLVHAEPRAADRIHVRLTRTGSTKAASFDYTPVTHELATMHGKLGAFLHYTFFFHNDAWYVKGRSESGIATLLDVRELVAEGIAELTQATKGTLLSPPSFAAFVLAINEGEDLLPP